MGVVYKAFDNVTKRFVAVKTIKGAMDPNAIEMFHKEWGVLARLCHPNIIDILDIGDFIENQWRQPYFVMPLLPGTTLDKLIKTASRRLTPERTVEIICQACRGLQAAHDQGVVHRDIKPSNLFVMDDDTVKIIDFGVVHLADAETRTGIKGTLQYMAPEQLDLKPASTRSDIWSLGVVCYEALSGRKPFDGKNAQEIAEAIRSRMPAPVSDLNPVVNVQISQTVQRALAKEPYHRVSSIREFSELLQRALRNERIEIFDRNKILPRINRVKKALNEGDYQFAMEIIAELDSEGNIDHEISLLRIQAEQAARAKTIHQLLESARTRMEEEEYPLALQKVQSVLALEPSNVDALALKGAIERQRSSTQTERWHQIARQHIDNKLFTKARQAIEEILKIEPSSESAKELLIEISRGEQQVTKLRHEKQELYDSALKSYRNGEISTALTKLERVIEIGKLAPGHPNTEAQYLAFYEQIRSERDELRNAYNEGKKALETRDFARALEICRTVLSRRPREPLFQALKIEVEDLQRQESSAAVAEVHSRIEAEPDLDRKCALLKDAARQFSDEQTFQHSYRIVKERRDLVNSIVSRARHYESQGQFLEASNQWDVLHSIYSQYPGLDLEIQRLARKQEELLREQEEAGLLEKIDQALASGDYTVARGLLTGALAEFPHNPQLIERKRHLDEALERRSQTAILLDEARKLARAGNRPAAIEKLRSARELDRTNQLVPAQLASTLIEEARVAIYHDWRAAQALIEEVFELNPGDRDAAEIRLTIEDIRSREEPVQFSPSSSYEVESDIPEATATMHAAQSSEARNRFETVKAWQAAAAGAGASLPAAYSLGSNAAGEASSTGGSQVPLPGHDSKQIAPIPTLVRRADENYGVQRKKHSGSKILAAVAALILISAALFFIWMLRRNNSAQSLMANRQTAGQNASQKDASGVASVMPDKLPLPQAPPMNPASEIIPFHFASTPAAAELVVDGDENLKCVTPCDLRLRYGRHTFTMSAPNYETAQGIIEVPEDRDRLVALMNDLETVHIYSVPKKMNISVDGKSEGQTPVILQLPTGEHKITSTGDASYQGGINVKRGGMNIFTINGKPAASDRGGADAAAPSRPHS